MLVDVVEVKPLSDYRLWVKFEDGEEGTINVKKLVEFTGVFEPLANPGFFAQASVNPELGVVSWPNGADLDPDVLYSVVTGKPLPAVVDGQAAERP